MTSIIYSTNHRETWSELSGKGFQAQNHLPYLVNVVCWFPAGRLVQFREDHGCLPLEQASVWLISIQSVLCTAVFVQALTGPSITVCVCVCLCQIKVNERGQPRFFSIPHSQDIKGIFSLPHFRRALHSLCLSVALGRAREGSVCFPVDLALGLVSE